MDWSKAKNIIIAVLLAANLFMGANLLSKQAETRARIRQAAQDSIAFLEQAGLNVDVQVPETTERLPVLFLRLQREGAGTETSEYKGTPIVVEGRSLGFEVAGTGQQAAEIIPASEALLKLYARLCEEGDPTGSRVEAIELVYRLSSDVSSYAAQDTAVPAWQIRVSGKTYYVNAYED